jgi:hypothetical protein
MESMVKAVGTMGRVSKSFALTVSSAGIFMGMADLL